MANWPFRFIHASDFHLERPLMGVAEVPDHLREVFLETPYTAALRVFEAALSEDVQFVVLPGGIVTPAATGPRGPLFLAEQFARLAERRIEVYWAGSVIDTPEMWPTAVKLPGNVHFFPRGKVEELLVTADNGPLARVAGVCSDERHPWRPTDFQPDPTGLYTVAVAHGEVDLAVLQTRGVHYWALGGRHDRSTPLSGAADGSLLRHHTRPAARGIRHARLHARPGRSGAADANQHDSDRRGALAHRTGNDRRIDHGRRFGISAARANEHVAGSVADRRAVDFVDDRRPGSAVGLVASRPVDGRTA